MKTLAPLEIGLSRPLLTREERLDLGVGLRFLYASDLHLRAGNGIQLAAELLESCSYHQVELVVLGGDLVDTPGGLPVLRELVHLLVNRGHRVAAVAGNHDRWVGFGRVEKAVSKAGGRWLSQEPLIMGQAQFHARPEGLRSGPVNIVCSHYPDCFPRAVARRLPLTLAGHLHGGQVVLWEQRGLLMPGGLVYRWNGLRFQEGESTLLVSRGMTDTVPLRWNCPREVLLVSI